MANFKKCLCFLFLLAGSLFGCTYFFEFGWITDAIYRGWHVSTGGNITGFINSLQTRSENKKEQLPKPLPECPETPPRLIGPEDVNVSMDLTLEYIVSAYPNVQPGGHFKPFDCVARQRIAVIIPFRKRETHLKLWLFYMHQFLQRQEGDYTIYVIEQNGDQQFNRAKLMNVGFTEALKNYNHDCFVFSDIDIVPMDDRNYYRCSSNPRHMANAVDKFNFG